VDSTGAAQGHAAAELRSSQSSYITQIPQQGHFRIAIKRLLFPVNFEADHLSSNQPRKLGCDCRSTTPNHVAETWTLQK
jgi:hypothetical protein